MAFFLLFRERHKKDYKPLSCMSHISHSIPFSGIPITLLYENTQTITHQENTVIPTAIGLALKVMQ